jgi:hypothetical protein
MKAGTSTMKRRHRRRVQQRPQQRFAGHVDEQRHGPWASIRPGLQRPQAQRQRAGRCQGQTSPAAALQLRAVDAGVGPLRAHRQPRGRHRALAVDDGAVAQHHVAKKRMVEHLICRACRGGSAAGLGGQPPAM